jgi:hypothetical protein
VHLPAKASRHAKCPDFQENKSGTLVVSGQASCAQSRTRYLTKTTLLTANKRRAAQSWSKAGRPRILCSPLKRPSVRGVTQVTAARQATRYRDLSSAVLRERQWQT